ncbi:MAG TPA: hypothetical protein VFL41_06030 [Gaiellaceae bacterium]|nr:hypothetical protein [Gaiellaceae bacterium]
MPAASGQRRGSPNATTAIRAEKSGAIPNRIPARDAPAARTACTTTSCEQPGTKAPRSRNGQSSPASKSLPAKTAAAATSMNANVVMTAAPAAGSGTRASARRIVMFTAPRKNPAAQAKRTPVTYLVFEW